MPSFEQVELRTSRLRLRPLTESDAPALFRIFEDPEVRRYLTRRQWKAVEEAQALIAQDRQALAEGRYLRLGLEPVDGGGIIGECSLFNLAEESRRAEIGYALGMATWGHGYMGEALTALVTFAFAELGLNRLEADIDPRNEASARTLDRLGFRTEGLLRERWIVAGEISDSRIYGLLRLDWQTGQKRWQGADDYVGWRFA